MRLIACLTLLLAATSSSTADVYRSVAPDGTVIYSDRPSGSDSQPVFIATTRGNSPAAPRPAPRPAAAPGADDEAGGGDAAPQPVSAAETAEVRARNCEAARGRVERYNAAHRLFRSLPNGEREYLSDAEIDEARAQAAADVENWCD